ncbi:hypothetical protein BDZ94DRAFT_1322983 [Collybia nuda]|uniref:Ketosynthase family 3 (KS3) domain-containing protein n=1 Tax=Collybia nuda TaxID=64659 RepID=A0A9P6CH47_9AGAR|nr:hypothetical protein BDZ94DRAFT_1322983 [Collybia nuda]
MNLTDDSPCVIGSSCRLPGAIRTDALWQLFCDNSWKSRSTLPPSSRGLSIPSPIPSTGGRDLGHGGWLGEEGIEKFDPSFFDIPTHEAATLRPNVRLGLELTWEALENAGIPPSSLRGRSVSVSIAVGTEDGWDMKRWQDEGSGAFNRTWASSSDPSGVSGHISHFFDFRGSCSVVSNACAGGAFALKEGINTLYQENAEIAIVGALATHFSLAPFAWAADTGVLSKCGHSAAFSLDSDGYSPSEGAVFLVLQRFSNTQTSGNAILGIIRSLATAHNGATRTLVTPSTIGQVTVAELALKAAEITPSDITFLEAHGTGTQVGDALEAEGIREVYSTSRHTDEPLLVSSSKTIFGHCHGAAALVGLLKVLACFENRCLPPHHAAPRPEFLNGPIQIPVKLSPLRREGMLTAQLNTFGFTGSVASIIIQNGSPQLIHEWSTPNGDQDVAYILPFSGKTKGGLDQQIRTVCSWAKVTRCNLRELSAILGICRDHFSYRCAIIARNSEDLGPFCVDFSVEGSTVPELNKFVPDDRVTLRFLNLKNIDQKLFSLGSPEKKRLDDLLEANKILQAACLLYNHHHPLLFEAIYSKHDLDLHLMRSLPFYQFDRRRHWWGGSEVSRVDHTLRIPSGTTAQAPPLVTQQIFESMIQKYGFPIDATTHTKQAHTTSTISILLTGGNGMLGVHLLARLLQRPNVRVYCIIRGDPWRRLCVAFEKHALDLSILHSSKAEGSLYLMQSDNLFKKHLGLSNSDYSTLMDNIDEIVHGAWKVNFNLPLKEFEPFLEVTRSLAKLCIASGRRVKYHFISSYASTFGYPNKFVPENVLEPHLSYSIPQGYAISKLVGEHSLHMISSASPESFQLIVIRVGQICGTLDAPWSQDEMVPMMIASLPKLGVLPLCLPDVAWIPADICADALRDIIFHTDHTSLDPQILHLANPHVVPWSTAASQIAQFTNVKSFSLTSWEDYINAIQHTAESLPICRLLPYFSSGLETGGLPENYALLEVSHTLKFSPSLASCPPIEGKLLRKIVQLVTRETIDQPGPIFVFGPWSGARKANKHTTPNSRTERMKALSARLRASLGDCDLPDASLDEQLETLATHLNVATELLDKGVTPSAVLGYCFGEYAASIVAGILSEECVVNILVRRAIAIRDTRGNMLNVFSTLAVVRRLLASISSPPSIAIHVGPNHVVLSGSPSQIEAVQQCLDRDKIKTLLLNTTLPFHSNEMSAATNRFSEFSFTPKDTPILYFSGVTGAPLRGKSLSMTYWQRHMREPARFYDAMLSIRETIPNAPIIDIGPGSDLTKVINRYGWPGMNICTANDHVVAASHTRKPPARSVASPPTERPQHILDSTISRTTEQDPYKIALELLTTMFGFQASPGLLRESLHTLGVQSMDFIQFSQVFGSRTGLLLSLSAFVSDAPLNAIISSATSTNQAM